MLDFGGPVLRTPFELLRGGEVRSGLPAGTLAWSGPFDPSSDDLWRSLQDGEITERAYWQRRADEFAAATGGEATFQGLMQVLFDADEDDLLRPSARPLVVDAKAAGLAVAVCTNDMAAFHDAAWIAHMTILGLMDVIVDGSVEHDLKPDPRIFALVVERLGIPAAECLFVDDQPGNVDGARSVGMRAVWFDVTDPEGSDSRVRAELGLAS